MWEAKVGPEVFATEGVQGFFELPGKLGNVSDLAPVKPPRTNVGPPLRGGYKRFSFLTRAERGSHILSFVGPPVI